MKNITSENAVRVLCYMMLVDGKITDEERETYNAIGKEVDPERFDDYGDSLLKECESSVGKTDDEHEYYKSIKKKVKEVLKEENNHIGQFFGVDPLTKEPMNTNNKPFSQFGLLWDMITMGYSDSDYSEYEKKLVKYVAKKLEVKVVSVNELIASYDAVVKIDNEIKWIKESSSLSYGEAEKLVRELEKRMSVIHESIVMLSDDIEVVEKED